MNERSIPPGGVKSALELGPVALFFLGYIFLRDRLFFIGGTEYEGFIIVTAAFVPIVLAATFLLWRLTGQLSKIQILTAALVVVFGGLSVWLNDERFFKMKPTLIYLLFGAALAVGLLRGESYLRALMGELMPLNDAGWMKLTRRICAFFFALAVVNEIVWRTMSTDAWVGFKTFGLPIAIFVFFFSQSGLLSKNAGRTGKDG